MKHGAVKRCPYCREEEPNFVARILDEEENVKWVHLKDLDYDMEKGICGPFSDEGPA